MAEPIYDIMRHLKATGDNCEKLYRVLDENKRIIYAAKGSQHNHQAWEGGYLQHVADCISIAIGIHHSMFVDMDWPVPFRLSSVILVLFLHDIEKPFMQDRMAEDPEMPVWSKVQRMKFRSELCIHYNIQLTNEELLALHYIHGEGEDYSTTERKMNELGALCHAADVLSARVWHSRNKPE